MRRMSAVRSRKTKRIAPAPAPSLLQQGRVLVGIGGLIANAVLRVSALVVQGIVVDDLENEDDIGKAEVSGQCDGGGCEAGK